MGITSNIDDVIRDLKEKTVKQLNSMAKTL